jgi:RNA polymerase sigma-70 factor (ECF subfamily)
MAFGLCWSRSPTLSGPAFAFWGLLCFLSNHAIQARLALKQLSHFDVSPSSTSGADCGRHGRMASVTTRSNSEWVSDLGSAGQSRDRALADLRALLVKGLRYALADRRTMSQLDPADRAQLIQDFTQDALTHILSHLDTFRGESAFTTWAQKIAVRVALTELRRMRWRDVSLEQLTQIEEKETTPAFLSDPMPNPEQVALRNSMLATLERIIMEELTEKQRIVMIAARIHDMPLEEVGRRIGSNRNAVYKMLHDARQRLKRRLEAEGLTLEDFMKAFE